MKAANNKALNIKLPEDLYSRLHKAAEKEYNHLAALVRRYCAEGLRRDGYLPDDEVWDALGDPVYGNTKEADAEGIEPSEDNGSEPDGYLSDLDRKLNGVPVKQVK